MEKASVKINEHCLPPLFVKDRRQYWAQIFELKASEVFFLCRLLTDLQQTDQPAKQRLARTSTTQVRLDGRFTRMSADDSITTFAIQAWRLAHLTNAAHAIQMKQRRIWGEKPSVVLRFERTFRSPTHDYKRPGAGLFAGGTRKTNR